MKPDSRNRIPKGMLYSLIAGAVLSFALLTIFGVFRLFTDGGVRITSGIIFAVVFIICIKSTAWCIGAYRAFSYDGGRKLSKQIIEGTAENITLPEGGIGLDVGCGSCVLTTACATSRSLPQLPYYVLQL